MDRFSVVASARAWADAYRRWDIARIMSFYSRECVCAGPTWKSPVSGLGAIRELTAMCLRAFPDARLEVSPPVVCGNRVAVEWLLTGTHSGPFAVADAACTIAATGRSLRVPGASYAIYDSEGLIVEKRDYWSLGTLTMLALNLPARSELEAFGLTRGAPHRTDPPSIPLVLGSVVIDFSARTAMRGPTQVTLTRREFDVLRYLADRPHSVVSRQELLKGVWDYPGNVPTRVVDVTIARLRKKIDGTPDGPKYLHAAYGGGYYLTPDRDTGDRSWRRDAALPPRLDE